MLATDTGVKPPRETSSFAPFQYRVIECSSEVLDLVSRQIVLLGSRAEPSRVHRTSTSKLARHE